MRQSILSSSALTPLILDSPPATEPNNSANYPGRLLAIDLGAKRVGVAVSDELRITANPLPLIERRSWKDLLRQVVAIVETYDARGLVIGLPLNIDGSEGSAAADAHRIAENFRRSLRVPVYLQDERLTSLTAQTTLKSAGANDNETRKRIDSESAAIILRDFIAAHPEAAGQEQTKT